MRNRSNRLWLCQVVVCAAALAWPLAALGQNRTYQRSSSGGSVRSGGATAAPRSFNPRPAPTMSRSTPMPSAGRATPSYNRSAPTYTRSAPSLPRAPISANPVSPRSVLGASPVRPLAPRPGIGVAGPTPTLSGSVVAGQIAPAPATMAQPRSLVPPSAISSPLAYPRGAATGTYLRSQPGGSPPGAIATVVPPGVAAPVTRSPRPVVAGSPVRSPRGGVAVVAPGRPVVGTRGVVVPGSIFRPRYMPPAVAYRRSFLSRYGSVNGFAFGFCTGFGAGYPVYDPYPVAVPVAVPVPQPVPGYDPNLDPGYGPDPYEGEAGQAVYDAYQDATGPYGYPYAYYNNVDVGTLPSPYPPSPARDDALNAAEAPPVDPDARQQPEAAPDQQGQQPPPAGGAVPPEHVQKLMREGVESFHNGDYDHAARSFLQAAMSDRGNPDSWLAYAIARFASGDYEMSAMAVRRGVRQGPGVVNAPIDVRERYGKRDDFAKQVRSLERYVQDHAEDADGWLVLGFVRHFSGDRNLGRRAFEVIQRRFEQDGDLAKAFLNAKARPAEAPPGQPGEQPMPEGVEMQGVPDGAQGAVAPGGLNGALESERALRESGLTQQGEAVNSEVYE